MARTTRQVHQCRPAFAAVAARPDGVIVLAAALCFCGCAQGGRAEPVARATREAGLSRVLARVYEALEAGDVGTMRRSIVTTADEQPAAGTIISLTEDVAAIRRLAATRFGAAQGPRIGIDPLPPVWTKGTEVVRGNEGWVEFQPGGGRFLFQRAGGHWRLAYTRTVRRLFDEDKSRAYLKSIDRLARAASGIRGRLERAEFRSLDALQAAVDDELGRRVVVRLEPEGGA